MLQVHKNTIKMAIDERLCLEFQYQSQKDSTSRKRVIHPYVFGRKSSNKEFVFGLQVEGGKEPGLRMYSFDNMKQVTIVEGSFEDPKDPVKTDQWQEIYESV